MVQLYIVDSPINREQRNNVNATFADIQTRLSNLRYQISILTGGADLEEIINRIEDTITNANDTTANTQQVLDDITAALGQLQTALDNNNTAIQNTETVIQDARTAITDLNNELTVLQNIINQLGNAGTYDNAVTYQKNNVVEYNGSSFIAIQQTTGNLPPVLPLRRNDYWQLLAQRGVDGAGSVSSINNVSPDVSGNVTLTNENVGAVSNVEFDEYRDAEDRKMYVYVTDYGAVGDGTTDDTEAIRSAIAYASSLNVGNDGNSRPVVFFPHGRYRVTSTITINSNFLILKGLGGRNSTIEGIDLSGPMFDVISDYGNRFINLFLRNASASASRTLSLSRGEVHIVENCTLQNVTGNSENLLYYQGANVKVRNCSFENNEATAYCIRAFSSASQININTDIIGNYFGGVGRGLLVDTEGVTHRPEGIKVNSNTFLLTTSEQITLASVLYIDISNNIIDVANGININIVSALSGVDGVIITNNYFGNTPEFGQAVNVENTTVRALNINVSNNFFGTTGYAVRSGQSTDGLKIKGNTFANVRQSSVTANQSKNVIISDNIDNTVTFSLDISDGTEGGPFLISNNIFKGAQNVVRTSGDKFLISNNIGIS